MVERKFLFESLFKVLHWIIAILIICQGILGAANLRVPFLRKHLVTAIVVHQQVGLFILLCTTLLLSLRVITKRRSANGSASLSKILAKAVHASFYFLIFAEGFIGIWMMGLLGLGISIFQFHFALPIVKDRHLVFSTILQIHAAIALLLGILIVIHVLAALYHHFIARDDILKQMLPGKH